MQISNRASLTLLILLPAIPMFTGCSDGIFLTSNITSNESVTAEPEETSGASPSTSTSAPTSGSSMTPDSSSDALTDAADPPTTGETSQTSTTTPETCGDGLQDFGEECDHGAANADNHECTAACTLNVCGDGRPWDGVEACDGGGETALCNVDCTLAACGDGIINASADEMCEDGNDVSLDGCEITCRRTKLVGVYAGSSSEHTCVVVEGGNLKCWGYNSRGQLGHGHTENIGDDEPASMAGFVDVGGKVVQVALGNAHTCAILEDGAVRCWGYGKGGRLGTQDTGGTLCLDEQQKFKCDKSPECCIGDNEPPSAADPVELLGKAVDIVAGASHTCARLESGTVRCWGDGYLGQLGYGNTSIIGDDDDVIPNVGLADSAEQLYAGTDHTCAVLTAGNVRCWGYDGSCQLGLALGQSNNVGDDEPPVAVFPVKIGGNVAAMALGSVMTCAAMDGEKVRCWGQSQTIGTENGLGIGCEPNDMPPSDLKEIDGVEEIKSGGHHTCVRDAEGAVRCWGYAYAGALGNGTSEGAIGDELGEMAIDPVVLGGDAVMIAGGGAHVCAILADDRLKCWGGNFDGALGYGHTMNIGDAPDEMPPSDVPLFE